MTPFPLELYLQIISILMGLVAVGIPILIAVVGSYLCQPCTT